MTGGHRARTRTVQVLADPNGNRAQRRAAAAVARMNEEKASRLPRASRTPAPGPWRTRGRGVNGRSL